MCDLEAIKLNGVFVAKCWWNIVTVHATTRGLNYTLGYNTTTRFYSCHRCMTAKRRNTISGDQTATSSCTCTCQTAMPGCCSDTRNRSSTERTSARSPVRSSRPSERTIHACIAQTMYGYKLHLGTVENHGKKVGKHGILWKKSWKTRQKHGKNTASKYDVFSIATHLQCPFLSHW